MVYAMNAGLFDGGAYYLSTKLGLPIRSVFRGQIRPERSVIRFEQNFKEVSAVPGGGVAVISDSDVFWGGAHVVRTENISVVIDKQEWSRLK